jgi:hypothetical protein
VKSTITVTPDLAVHADGATAPTGGADATIATAAIAAPIARAAKVHTGVVIVS